MQLKNTREELNKFAKYVIQQSRANLTRQGKNVSSDLYKSLDYKVDTGANWIALEFFMLPYAYYQDRGVKGKTSTYPEIAKYGTLAKFGSGKGKKGGLTKGIDKWVRKKRFQFRNKETGRFMSYESTAFLITRSVYNKGIKPSLFFTKPFEKAFKNLPKELIESFNLDLDNFFDFTT